MTWMKNMLKKVYMSLVTLLARPSQKVVHGQVSILFSFKENNVDLIERLRTLPEVEKIIIFYTDAVESEIVHFKEHQYTCIKINHLRFFLYGLRALVRSQIVMMDNYFAFTGGLVFQKETTLYQLWHANGAIKCFGWEDAKTKSRNRNDKCRFQAVYDQVDCYVTASEEMSQVFEKSYHQPIEKMLEIGLPRTDYYFDANKKQQAKKIFKEAFPEAKGKKVILYAPTYREHEEISIDWANVLPDFGPEYLVLVKFHPHTPVTVKSTGQVLYEMRGMKLRELLLSVDILITDYSSVPFEYVLANRKGHTLYYTFDYQAYEKNIGIQSGFFQKNHLQIAQNKQELLSQLPGNVNTCLDNWNKANDGEATTRLLAHIKKKLVVKETSNDN